MSEIEKCKHTHPHTQSDFCVDQLSDGRRTTTTAIATGTIDRNDGVDRTGLFASPERNRGPHRDSTAACLDFGDDDGSPVGKCSYPEERAEALERLRDIQGVPRENLLQRRPAVPIIARVVTYFCVSGVGWWRVVKCQDRDMIKANSSNPVHASFRLTFRPWLQSTTDGFIIHPGTCLVSI